MHPTDTLLSLSHARIARAAAAGPRRATQPTAMSNAQHLARREQAGLRMQYTAGQPVELPASHAAFDQWIAPGSGPSDIVCITGVVRKDADRRFSSAIQQLRAAGDADSNLAHQIDAL